MNKPVIVSEETQAAPVTVPDATGRVAGAAATVVGAVPMLVMTRDSRRSPPSPVSTLIVPPTW